MLTLSLIEPVGLVRDPRDSGWLLQNVTFVPENEQAACVEIAIPDTKYDLRPFASDIVDAFEDYYTRERLLIQLTEWTLGTSKFDQVGWKTCELMRRAYGELRPLEAAPLHAFRYDEVVEARAFLMQIFINQWSAILIPQPASNFTSIDEEHLWIYVRDAKVAAMVCDRLERWKPKVL